MALNIYFFGDQTSNVVPYLRDTLLYHNQSDREKQFILEISIALRGLLANAPTTTIQGLPHFQNLYELIQLCDHDDVANHPAIAATLLCFAQLFQVHRHMASKSLEISAEDVRVIGLCTGSLAASAFCCTITLDDLHRIAIPIVCVAFQVGILAASAASASYQQDGYEAKWSCAFAHVSESRMEDLLEEFHTNGAGSHQCYISAITSTSITISGHPATLSRFIQSLEGIESTWLPIHAPYHHGKTYDSNCFQQIVQTMPNIDFSPLLKAKPRYDMLSSASGNIIKANSLLELLQTAVIECLQEPLRCDKIVNQCISEIVEHNFTTVGFVAVNPASLVKSVAGSLSSETKALVSVDFMASSVGEFGPSHQSKLNDEPIAIVGMAGRFPGANNTEELWHVLEQGLDLHKTIPSDRFDKSSHVDPSGQIKNTTSSPYGCFIDEPGLFDPRFFNMSPKEAAQTCPMQRISLLTAYEALEMSGFIPNRTASTNLDRIGTFFGQTSDDYREVNSSQDIGTYFITGGIRAFGPGRINYHFKFNGPGLSVDTACSSSLTAVQLACNSIWSRECDTAVAGGMNVISNPDLYAGYSRGTFLSKTGSCKTFDQEADGFCRGDAIGTIVLKRLSDALADNDTILATIRAVGTNHSSNAASITRPHVASQSKLYRTVLQKSCINPSNISYVEMHGTGTQAGDGAEMKSVTDVFAPKPRAREFQNPLYVGSAKSNVGHGEAASGITSLIKSILILQKDTIPPHCGIVGGINQSFPELKEHNVRIALQATPFPKRDNIPRTILVNNFSAAGGNTALILQEAHNNSRSAQDTRKLHPYSVSGHTEQSLKANIVKLVAYLKANPNTDLVSLCYTLTARRIQQKVRYTGTVASINQLQDQLLLLVDPRKDIVSPKLPKIAFVFTGQGSHYSNLGRQLYDTCYYFKSQLQASDLTARNYGFPSIIPLLDGSKNISELSPTQIQVGLVCIQMALVGVLNSWGITPSVVLGHSLGEYAAAHVAGIISASDTIYLVGTRARLFERNCTASTHAMLAVAESRSKLESLLQGLSFEYACFNSPFDTVLSGTALAIDEIEQLLKSQNIRCTKLLVPFAYHSSQVEPILEEFSVETRGMRFQNASCTFISPFLGRPISQREIIDSTYFNGHARKPVQFSKALQAAKSEHCIDDTTVFVEIGPHTVCSGMIKSTLGSNIKTLPTLKRKEDPWATLAETAATLHGLGVDVNWSEYHRDFTGALRLLHLPPYSWDCKNYWLEYKGDWCLSKGEMQNTRVTPSTPKNDWISTTLQSLVSEDTSSATPKFVFQSKLSDLHLHTAIRGHMVNGVGLCPASIYVDMALTATEYIQKQLPIKASRYNVANMNVTHPCMVEADLGLENRSLQLIATVDLAKQWINITISSTSTKNRIQPTQHATCIVQCCDDDRQWSFVARIQHLVKSRITTLEHHVPSVHKIFRGLAYRLLSTLVDMDEKYRGMDEVFLNSEQLEAMAQVSLKQHSDCGNFHIDPYWIDSLIHLSAFILNGNELNDSDQYLYISSGWDSMQFCKPLVAGTDYRVYVEMNPVLPNDFGGDIWIFKGNEVIGHVGNVKFRQIQRSVLKTIIHGGGTILTNLPPSRSLISPRALRKMSKSVVPVSIQDTLSEKTSTVNSVMAILAEEIGIPPSDIKDHDKLADLGIDSLMALTIAAKIKQKLTVEMPSTLLLEKETIGDALQLVSEMVPMSTSDDDSSSGDSGYFSQVKWR